MCLNESHLLRLTQGLVDGTECLLTLQCPRSCHLEERLHICHRCTPQPVLVFKTSPASIHVFQLLVVSLHPLAGWFPELPSLPRLLASSAISRCSSSVFPVFNQLRLMTTSSSVAPFSTASPASYSFTADVVAPEGKPITKTFGCLRKFSCSTHVSRIYANRRKLKSVCLLTPLFYLLWHHCWSQQGMVDERRNINV